MRTSSEAGTGGIVTLTPNPALDITLHVDGIRWGETHRVPTATSRAGGKGLNVARVAHQQGYTVLAVAPVGGANGRQFTVDLEASGVPHRLLEVAVETRRTFALVDTRTDQTSIFNEFGSPLSGPEWDALIGEVEKSLDDGAGALVVSGSLPGEAPPLFYAPLIELAHARGIPAVIDTSGSGLLEAAKAGADLLKPNREELQDATGISDPAAASRELLRLGARRVLTSEGGEGMLAFDAGIPTTFWKARLPAPLRGNPTGAGDAAVAAAAVELATGSASLTSILRAASSWSAAAVLMPVAGEISPHYEQLARQLIVTEEVLA
jgi:hypothetical protein